MAVLGLIFPMLAARHVSATDMIKHPSLFTRPADLRSVVQEDLVNCEPLFIQEAKTLDPLDLVRVAWQGYVTHRADPSGLTTDLQPMLKYNSNCRALPCVEFKKTRYRLGGASRFPPAI
jgi:hypothetical protein